MSKIAVAVGVVVLVAGGAAFYAQSEANAALLRQIGGLRLDVLAALKASRAASAAAQPSTATSSVPAAGPATASNQDLAKLRDEIAALRKSTETLTKFAEAAQAAQAVQALAKNSESIPTNLIPSSAWKNAGKATPEAATETVLWAALGGDVDALAGALTFTSSAKAKADAWFAGLSDSTRQQYGSPEKVIALMIAKDAATLSGMQVLGQKELTPDDVGVRVRFANDQGKTKDDNFVMHRAMDGWRLTLPDNAVEKFAKQLGGGK